MSATIHSVEPRAPLVPVRAVRGSVLRDPHALTDALAWVADQQARLGIGVVCLALGDSRNWTDDLACGRRSLNVQVRRLREAGVPVVAAAGTRLPGLRDHGQGSAWPAVLREVVSVGAAEAGRDGLLRLAPWTRRLHPRMGTGCSTTVFAVPGAPGGTSGAAAVVAGRLATLRAMSPDDSVDELVVALVRESQLVVEAGLEWPCLAPTFRRQSPQRSVGG